MNVNREFLCALGTITGVTIDYTQPKKEWQLCVDVGWLHNSLPTPSGSLHR